MCSPSAFILPTLPRSVVDASFWEPAETRSLQCDVGVSLLINVNETTAVVGTAALCGHEDDAASTLLHQMHDHSLAHNNACDFIGMSKSVIVEDIESNAYSYTFHATGKVLCTIVNVYSAGMYV